MEFLPTNVKNERVPLFLWAVAVEKEASQFSYTKSDANYNYCHMSHCGYVSLTSNCAIAICGGSVCVLCEF